MTIAVIANVLYTPVLEVLNSNNSHKNIDRLLPEMHKQWGGDENVGLFLKFVQYTKK